VLHNGISDHLIASLLVHAADRSRFGRNADKRVGRVAVSCHEKQGSGTHMSREQTAVYDPEELSFLANIFDSAVATLPPSMRTPANRKEIAKIILARAAAGEPALAPLIKFEIVAGS
jgi:hypothetical protein